MTKKDIRNIKQIHSKRTGAIILIALAFFLVGSAGFVYLAMKENEKFELELDNFLALSCNEIKNMDLEPWQSEAYLNMLRAGEC